MIIACFQNNQSLLLANSPVHYIRYIRSPILRSYLGFSTVYNVLKYVARASDEIAFASLTFWLFLDALWLLLGVFPEDTALVSVCLTVWRKTKRTFSAEHLDEVFL